MFACTNMDRPFDINLLDKLFKPSCWSKRYSPEQVESEHIAFTKNGKNSDCVSYCLQIWIKQRCISKYLFIKCIFVGHFFLPPDFPYFYWSILIWDVLVILRYHGEIPFHMNFYENRLICWSNSFFQSIDLGHFMDSFPILLQYWFKMQTACIYLSKFKYLLHFAIGRETIFASYLSKLITTTTNKRPTE